MFRRDSAPPLGAQGGKRKWIEFEALQLSWRERRLITRRVNRRAITEEIVRQRLSINVRSLRNGALLTLKKSSERAEMHWRHWQKIEAAQVNITLQTLVRMADVLGIDPADLLREPAQRPALKAPGDGARAEEPKTEHPRDEEPGTAPLEAEEPEASTPSPGEPVAAAGEAPHREG